MKRVLLTGMSGTGKSSVIHELVTRGYKAIDGDLEEWSKEVPFVPIPGIDDEDNHPDTEWIWREDRIEELLSTEDADVLFVTGCCVNMPKFYPQFDHIILLSAPNSVIVHRLQTRTDNPYGKRPGELDRVLGHVKTVEPLLRKAAGHEIETSVPLTDVVDRIIELTT